MPGIDSGAATPSDGNATLFLNVPTARCMRLREPGLAQPHAPRGRKRHAFPERSDRAVHEAARAQVRDEADEVALRRIEQAEGERIALAVEALAVPAQRLERQH